MSMCSTGPSNPDIAGIGVRAAFYAQVLLSLLISFWAPQPETVADDYRRTSRVTSASLVISAGVQYATAQSLSLVDGLLVSILLIMMDNSVIQRIPFGLFRMKFTSENLKKLIPSVAFDRVLGVITRACTTAWGIFAWVRIMKCGSGDLFVLFGHSIPLDTRGIQGFALFFFAFRAWYTFLDIIGLIVVLLMGERLLQKVDEAIAKTTTDEENTITTQQATIPPKKPKIVFEKPTLNTGKATVAAENPAGSSQSARAPSPLEQGVTIITVHTWMEFSRGVLFACCLLVWAIVVSAIEQTIRRNGLQEDLSAWTFGQALAISMVILSVMKAVSAVKNKWWPGNESLKA